MFRFWGCFTVVFHKPPATCSRFSAAGLTECGAQVEGPVANLSQFPESWQPQSFSCWLRQQCPSRSRLIATSFLRLESANFLVRLMVGSMALLTGPVSEVILSACYFRMKYSSGRWYEPRETPASSGCLRRRDEIHV